MNIKKITRSAAGMLLLAGAVPAAQAVDFEAGDWTLTIGGEINANYVYTSCATNSGFSGFGGTIAGGVVGACNANGVIGDSSTSSVRTGLLPGQLLIGAKTTQNGWDIAGTFGLYPGIVSNDVGAGGGSPNLAPGGNVALGSTSLDIRQAFLTLGSSEFGTIKAGRDFGIFGYDAIINDMSIPAVGGGSLNQGSPGGTTLGSIGFGYIYTDALSQINYTTPDFGGTTVTVGVVQTIDSLTTPTTQGLGETKPGVQWQVKHSWDTGFVSFNGLTLTANGVPDGSGGFDEERVTGVDLNWKQDFGPVGILASGYYTDGLGSVALLVDSFDANGNTRDSYGGIVQANYTMGKSKFGLNYGVSYLDENDADPNNLFKSNRGVTAGYYYSLTPNMLLTAEYTHGTSVNHLDEKIGADTVNAGMFFSF